MTTDSTVTTWPTVEPGTGTMPEPAGAPADPVREPMHRIDPRLSAEPENPGNTRQTRIGSSDASCASDRKGGVAHPEFDTMLHAVRAHFARYVMTCTEEDLDLLALWTVHTYLCMETYTTPRLFLNSPVPGSGKTTVVEHIEHLALNPVQMSTISSPALLTRMLNDKLRTILIDEADRALNPKKDGIEDVMAVLNSGYKRGASRPVLQPDKEKGWVAKEMPTFSPIVIAGNSPALPDDTRSRCITVLLMPAGENDVEETDWELIEPDVDLLRERIEQAAEDVRDHVLQHRPGVPAGCRGRMKERWFPLKRVATAASEEWAAKVDALIRRDLEEEQADRDAGLTREKAHVTLLRDVASIFTDYHEREHLSTTTLLEELKARNPTYWSDRNLYEKALTAKRLGNMLSSNYGIRPAQPSRGAQRGYYRQSFDKALKALRITTPPPLFQSDAHDASDDPMQIPPGITRNNANLANTPTPYCHRFGCTNRAEPGSYQCADHSAERNPS